MLTKESGKVAYAIMSFGGFLGIGEKYHPLPWHALDYDTGLGGYRVATAGETLREAPSYNRDDLELADTGAASWADTTDRYYARPGVLGTMSRRSAADRI
jgi:hypothetical protein